jgi:hypothetical protein
LASVENLIGYCGPNGVDSILNRIYVLNMASPIKSLSTAETCRELFAGYPLAVTPISHDGAVRSMVLMLQDADDVAFFDLTRHGGSDEPTYSLCAWGSGDVIDFGADGTSAPPELARKVVTRATPIPRHGSLWGWRSGDMLTALLTVHASYSPEHPEPRWAVLPLAGIPRAEWPPFTGEPRLGQWFWSYRGDCRIVYLNDLIAGTPDTVFWIAADPSPDRGFCVVAQDIKSPEGYVMCRGSYVYYRIQLSGAQLPSPSTLLSRTDLIDLAPRLRRVASND